MIRLRLHLPFCFRSRGAFSLLEVLIACTILALLIALLLGIVNGASSLWGHAEGRREATKEVREGLRMMAEDLHSAVITAMPETLLINDPELQIGDSKSLFFLVSHPRDQRHSGVKGDLCATGYFIADAPSGDGMRNLYRYHASGDDVAKAYLANTVMALYATAIPGNKNTELLARNITDLKIHPIGITGEKVHPSALRLTLAAVNASTARLITAKPEARERNDRLLRQHQVQLSTVVSLPPQREIPGNHETSKP